jgi:hypothetical protein
MATEHQSADSDPETGQASGVMSRAAQLLSSELSPAQKAWCAVVAVLLVSWFFVAWLMLDRHFLDAAGESVGTACGLLLLVSIIGAFRKNT